MQDIVANVSHFKFDVEHAIEQQLGAQPLPFPGMDKSGSAICTFFLLEMCTKGPACPFRHVRGDKKVVCKHWLRGLCKKGDDCEFLHEYDMSKMPECFFFTRFGLCTNKECPFLHIDPSQKIKSCPWYDRGFCRHGLMCKNKHVRRVLCQNYLCGFCLDGATCKLAHPSFEIPTIESMIAKVSATELICHFCYEKGHKASSCTKMTPADLPTGMKAGVGIVPRTPKPLDQVTCFKCGVKGHYANACSTPVSSLSPSHMSFIHSGPAGIPKSNFKI